MIQFHRYSQKTRSLATVGFLVVKVDSSES